MDYDDEEEDDLDWMLHDTLSDFPYYDTGKKKARKKKITEDDTQISGDVH